MSINNLERAMSDLIRKPDTASARALVIEDLGMLRRAMERIDVPVGRDVEIIKDRMVDVLTNLEADLECM